MSFELFVALRYLTARRKQAFISLISGVSILGVGVGVMALIIATALMTGLQGELRDRIVGSTAHVYVYKLTGDRFGDFQNDVRPLAVPDVTGAAPAVIGKALAQAAGGVQAAIDIKGIDPAREPDVTNITQSIVSGSYAALTDRPPDRPDAILLGADLAERLDVRVGDSIDVISPEGPLSPLGRSLGHRRFQVVGTFRFGFYEVDSGFGFVTIGAAESFFHRDGRYDFIQLRVRNLYDAGAVADALQKRLGGGYQVQDWEQMNGTLYSALWLEKMAIALTIGLIVMVAALNIVASLVLLVMEKSRDIAILRTMGARATSIRRIFVLQGLVIGCLGTFGGAAIGVTASVVLDHFQVIKLPSDVYQITYLPFHVLPVDVLVIVGSAIAVCFLATLYPSRQAGRLDPAEALRYQ